MSTAEKIDKNPNLTIFKQKLIDLVNKAKLVDGDKRIVLEEFEKFSDENINFVNTTTTTTKAYEVESPSSNSEQWYENKIQEIKESEAENKKVIDDNVIYQFDKLKKKSVSIISNAILLKSLQNINNQLLKEAKYIESYQEGSGNYFQSFKEFLNNEIDKRKAEIKAKDKKKRDSFNNIIKDIPCKLNGANSILELSKLRANIINSYIDAIEQIEFDGSDSIISATILNDLSNLDKLFLKKGDGLLGFYSGKPVITGDHIIKLLSNIESSLPVFEDRKSILTLRALKTACLKYTHEASELLKDVGDDKNNPNIVNNIDAQFKTILNSINNSYDSNIKKFNLNELMDDQKLEVARADFRDIERKVSILKSLNSFTKKLNTIEQSATYKELKAAEKVTFERLQEAEDKVKDGFRTLPGTKSFETEDLFIASKGSRPYTPKSIEDTIGPEIEKFFNDKKAANDKKPKATIVTAVVDGYNFSSFPVIDALNKEVGKINLQKENKIEKQDSKLIDNNNAKLPFERIKFYPNHIKPSEGERRMFSRASYPCKNAYEYINKEFKNKVDTFLESDVMKRSIPNKEVLDSEEMFEKEYLKDFEPSHTHYEVESTEFVDSNGPSEKPEHIQYESMIPERLEVIAIKASPKPKDSPFDRIFLEEKLNTGSDTNYDPKKIFIKKSEKPEPEMQDGLDELLAEFGDCLKAKRALNNRIARLDEKCKSLGLGNIMRPFN